MYFLSIFCNLILRYDGTSKSIVFEKFLSRTLNYNLSNLIKNTKLSLACIIPLPFHHRLAQQIVHIGFNIIKLFHISPGLLVSRVGFPFLLQKSGVFLPQRFDGRQLCQRRTEKIPKRRPGNDPNARIATPVFHAGTPSAGYISAGMSIGGTVWTPALSRSRRR